MGTPDSRSSQIERPHFQLKRFLRRLEAALNSDILLLSGHLKALDQIKDFKPTAQPLTALQWGQGLSLEIPSQKRRSSDRRAREPRTISHRPKTRSAVTTYARYAGLTLDSDTLDRTVKIYSPLAGRAKKLSQLGVCDVDQKRGESTS